MKSKVLQLIFYIISIGLNLSYCEQEIPSFHHSDERIVGNDHSMKIIHSRKGSKLNSFGKLSSSPELAASSLDVVNDYDLSSAEETMKSDNRNHNIKSSRTRTPSASNNEDNEEHFSSSSSSEGPQENFILTDYLADGEFERRLLYNEIMAKETTVGYNSSNHLSLWQMTNGKGFIQMIYSNGGEDLIDCEYVKQKNAIRKFQKEFLDAVNEAKLKNITSDGRRQNHRYRHVAIAASEKMNEFNLQKLQLRNVTYARIEDRHEIPYELSEKLNYNYLKTICFKKHRELKRVALEHDLEIEEKELNRDDDENEDEDDHDNDEENADGSHHKRSKRSIMDVFMVPNTKWCGRGQQAGTYNQLGGASRADKCCRKHDHCRLNIQGLTTKWQLFNYLPFTISHCSCDKRQRRDLTNLLRVPGTKWCGKGWSAKRYSDLGGHSKADRCCRQHDKSCPFWIMGFETKYGLFNWRVSTLMHCKCDERFRTCLKVADSPDASMVGKIFFNIVQTKCFVLKKEEVCKRHTWWGKCEKKVMRKRAHLRDNRKF